MTAMPDSQERSGALLADETRIPHEEVEARRTAARPRPGSSSPI